MLKIRFGMDARLLASAGETGSVRPLLAQIGEQLAQFWDDLRLKDVAISPEWGTHVDSGQQRYGAHL